VLVGDPSCCSALDLLNGLDLTCSVGIPYSGCVLKKWANKGFVRSFLCLLVADLEVAPEETEGLVGLVCGRADVGSPPHLRSSWMVTPRCFVMLTFSRMG